MQTDEMEEKKIIHQLLWNTKYKEKKCSYLFNSYVDIVYCVVCNSDESPQIYGSLDCVHIRAPYMHTHRILSPSNHLVTYKIFYIRTEHNVARWCKRDDNIRTMWARDAKRRKSRFQIMVDGGCCCCCRCVIEADIYRTGLHTIKLHNQLLWYDFRFVSTSTLFCASPSSYFVLFLPFVWLRRVLNVFLVVFALRVLFCLCFFSFLTYKAEW